jgi:hypothetical protein
MLDVLAMGGFRITNLGTPVNPGDATTKSYVDGALTVNPVTAAATITDNSIVRGDGGSRGVQGSAVLIDDTTGTMYLATSDSGALGTTAKMWADLFLASGGVINWGNGDATITHSSGALSSNVPLDVGGSVVALLGTENQTLAGGAVVTEKDLGTQTSGTLTPDPGDRPMQIVVNGGAFTLSPGTNVGYYILTITNNSSAGAITTSGWTKVVGTFGTTNGNKYRCGCSIGAAGSVLQIQAMQ